MDDGYGVNFTEIYIGLCTEYLVEGLSAGTQYSFYLTATNFNGNSSRSPVAIIKSCIAPYNVEAPWLIETTATTVHLRWSKPEEGGCPI